MDDEARTRKLAERIAETTIRNRAEKGIQYPEGTAQAMVEEALEYPWGIKALDAMELVLKKAERA